jgi:hypothetical protein
MRVFCVAHIHVVMVILSYYLRYAKYIIVCLCCFVFIGYFLYILMCPIDLYVSTLLLFDFFGISGQILPSTSVTKRFLST